MDRDDRESFDGLLTQNASVKITRHTESVSRFSGPLPPPEVLAQYEQVAPGTASVIVSMAHAQMQHRQTIEHAVITGNVAAQKRGQIFALIVTFAALGTALWFGLLGYPNVSAVIGGSTILGLAGLFITSKYMQASERKEKNEQRV